MKRSRYLLIVASIILLLVPIAFYVYYFFNHQISTDPKDWGPFGDYFGGILNPIISLFTLIVTVSIALELNKFDERRNTNAIETTYKPELIISEKYFHLYPGRNGHEKVYLEFSDSLYPDTFSSQYESPGQLDMQLLNIGLGPTKKIQLTYSFDIEKFITLLGKFNEGIDPAKQIKVKVRGGILDIDHGDISPRKITHVYVNQQTTFIPYLLTVNQSPKPYILHIPQYISELFTIYTYLLITSKDTVLMNRVNFPEITLKLEYADIANKLFIKHISIKLANHIVTGTSSHCRLNVKELN